MADSDTKTGIEVNTEIDGTHSNSNEADVSTPSNPMGKHKESIRRETMLQIEAAWKAQQRLMRCYFSKVEEEKK